MKRGVRFIVAAVALVAAAIAFWFFERRPPLPSPFAFCVASNEDVARSRAHEMTPRLLAAGLLTLSTDERAPLVEALDNANARLEGRVNPLVDDLDDGDPENSMKEWFAHAPSWVPTLNAATMPIVCATDRFCVHVAAGPDGQCRDKFHRADTQSIDRARFLMWPFGNAVWVRTESNAEARSVADLLRAHASTSKTIGLVLHADDEKRIEDGQVASLREQFVRYAALSRLNEVRGKQGDFEARLRDEVVPNLARPPFDSGDVLVLGRHEVIGNPTLLADECGQIMASAKVRARAIEAVVRN